MAPPPIAGRASSGSSYTRNLPPRDLTAQSSKTEPIAPNRKVIIAASIGTFIEYFDLVLYGALAAIMATVFFAGEDDVSALLSTFAVFALAFVARPLGGLFWGPLGDRIGRKRVLSTIIIVMSVSTALVGLIPSYDSVGVVAPLALVILRFIQGISAGGEMPGAAVYIVEYAPKHRRAFQASFLQMGASSAMLAGLLVGAALTATLSHDALYSWGWRIPFLLALPIGAVGLYIRTKLEETPVFRAIEEAGARSQGPVMSLVSSVTGWKLMGRALLFSLPTQLTGYMILTYMPSFLKKNSGLSATEALLAISVATVVILVCQPLGGLLADKVGRRPMLFFCSAGIIIAAYPTFALLLQGGMALSILALCLLAIPFALASGNQLAASLEIFPTKVRFTGFALVLGVAVATLGGTAPYVSTWLVQQTGSLYSPAFYLMLSVLPALLIAPFLRETFRDDLSRNDPI
ncbi:L-Proline/Glycine betaine transporter ProP [Rhodococcus wratislaviensis]|uniref:Putative proline/betaine transporter n=1 Tax=Rhodococcus wratislaviensis TaxID=44752 RepID=A0A402CEW2_RHOWR|nr:L-Proline/Glycine betaine transporter ProP [Rhodococcus wratislaviensis]